MEVKKRCFSRLCFVPILVLLAAPAYGEKSKAQEVAPPDVFAHVARVRDEIDLIRLEMGKPKLGHPEIKVTQTAMREVFFQALTLYRDANQLCSELTGKRASPHPVPSEEIRPAHVFKVVHAALERLQVIKRDLGIGEQSVKPERDAGKTPSDVFRSIVQANRQLNLMLANQIAPSDVYQEVTEAISYTAFLLGEFPAVEAKIPAPLPFERRKVPADVYRRLIKCLGLIQKIVNLSGLTILKAELGGKFDRMIPGDVYNLASLVVSELAYLNRVIGNNQPTRSFYPGRKFPSHVYQAVGILETQLQQLLEQVKVKPDWLKK